MSIKAKLRYLFPIIGIILFFALYVYASSLYPGGSQWDEEATGFDWEHNYWCNLLNEYAINGQYNPARRTAIGALFILCISLGVFFLNFGRTYVSFGKWKKLIPTAGILSMMFASLVFTKYHDLMTTLSSVFGFIAVLGIIIETYRSHNQLLKIWGVIAIFLLGLNNYIYYTENFIETLPVLQKLTFLIVLLWVIVCSVMLYKKAKILSDDSVGLGYSEVTKKANE